MTKLSFHTEREDVPSEPLADEINVWLFGPSPPNATAGSVGASLYDEASRLGLPPRPVAMDLVAIAMAVTAADTFVSRDDAPNRWARDFELSVPLCDPAPWNEVKDQLEKTLAFLSGDSWSFSFRDGGKRPPSIARVKSLRRTHNLTAVDCVALFSGGMDSSLGVLDLLESKRRPFLVSHAPSGDAQKQETVSGMLPKALQRFAFNSYPTWAGVDDDSMRSRSFQFLAAAALVADTMSQFRGGREIELFLCENGLIALNPPLTARRIGSHSTRTAHPHYLSNMAEILGTLGFNVRIRNPHRLETKGEMLARHTGVSNIAALATATVSCGKWKRMHKQCGRCVPCLIRRASFHAAGVADGTPYQEPRLSAVLENENVRDDLIAVQVALSKLESRNLRSWVLQGGPLPTNKQERSGLFDVAERGFSELRNYLSSEGLG